MGMNVTPAFSAAARASDGVEAGDLPPSADPEVLASIAQAPYGSDVRAGGYETESGFCA